MLAAGLSLQYNTLYFLKPGFWDSPAWGTYKSELQAEVQQLYNSLLLLRFTAGEDTSSLWLVV